MIKLKRIPITFKTNRPIQRCEWNEPFTGEITLKAGTKLYHSSSLKLRAFYPKMTCFSFEYEGHSEHIYCLVIKKDIIGYRFDYDEVRIDLALEKDNVEIYYIGYGKVIRVRDELGRVIGYKYNYDDLVTI